MARKDLTQLKMRFPNIDSYIANFKQTIRKALYRLGSHEMNQQFLSGLPRDIAEDVMCYPTPITYQEYSQKALASVRSKVLLKNIFGGGNKNFGTFAPQQQWLQWNNPCPQGQNNPQGNATTTGNSSNACFQCREIGHFTRNCPKHCQNNQYNCTANLIDFNDGQNYTDANIIEEDPVETLQAQLNSLSTQDREKLTITMGGGDQQDFPSA